MNQIIHISAPASLFARQQPNPLARLLDRCAERDFGVVAVTPLPGNELLYVLQRELTQENRNDITPGLEEIDGAEQAGVVVHP